MTAQETAKSPLSVSLVAVLGHINDTCIIMYIIIQKASSSIMINPQRSISITDTFGEYQYHKILIHYILNILNDS